VDADGEALIDAEGLALIELEGLTLAEDDALSERDGDALTELDGDTLALGEADGPRICRSRSVDAQTNEWSTLRCRAGSSTIRICAPPSVSPALLGEAEALRLAERDLLWLALILLDAVAEGDALSDGEGDALALEIISRTANVTMARSSVVPLLSPTARDPCPAVFSRAPTKHWPPTSNVLVAVEFAPAVGGV